MRHTVMTALVCMAAIPAFGAGMASHIKKDNPFYTDNSTVTLNGKKVVFGKAAPLVTRAGEENPGDGVIREVEGESQLYTKDAAGTWVLGGAMELYGIEPFPATIVWGDNNEVYVKDFLSTIACETYIKGEVRGNEIVFQTNQLVDYVEAGDDSYGLALGMYKSRVSGDYYFFDFVPTITEFSMTINSDGTLSLVMPGKPFNGLEVPEYTLGYYTTDDLAFTGYSDFYQKYTKQEQEMITMPSGVTPEEYVYIDDFDFASFVQVAYTDDYIYIQGLDPMLPEGTIRARIEGSKAYVSQNQYLGVYMDIDFIYTKILLLNPDFDENIVDSEEFYFAPPEMEFELKFDREAGIIYADNPGVYLSFQPDEDTYINSNCVVSEFTLRYQKDNKGTPAPPSHLEYTTKWVPYQGFSDFMFHISNYSTEGTLLDQNYLLYRVWVDGEPIIFGEQEVTDLLGEQTVAYEGVPGQQYWLPYDFYNGEDITKWSSSEVILGIYVPVMESLSVQMGYVLPDVTPTFSDIVTLNVLTGDVTTSPSGVKAVSVAPVEKIEYYSLSGVKIASPRNGVYLKRITRTDGTVTTDKVIMR